MAAKDKVILFSGRYDRPHCGHVATLQRLGRQYKKVIVVVLRYDGEEYPATYRLSVLKSILDNSYGCYEVYINREHFAKITRQQIDRHGWKFDVYGAGNHEVLKHMEKLGYQVEYVERAFDYDAKTDRMMKKIREVMNG